MINVKKKDVIIIGNGNWHGLWYQSQQFACAFAAHGHRVYYLTKILQQWPTIDHFRRRFFSDRRRLHGKNLIPENVHIVEPLWLPPARFMRPINRMLIRRTISSLGISSPIIITYIAPYNILDFIELVRGAKVAYINVHNYDADSVMPDLLMSERELIVKADILLADSTYNQMRISRLANGRHVYPALPGVDYHRFSRAYRGDESQRRKTLYYFGGVGPHLDLQLYRELSKRLRVVFIGVVSRAVRDKIPDGITICPPVPNSELPALLTEADILSIFYKNSSYIRGVIPAKLFECFATGKPVLVSGLEEAAPYENIAYNVCASPEQACQVIDKLEETETMERLACRQAVGQGADWSNRFAYLTDCLRMITNL